MTRSTDKLVDVYFSEDANALKNRSLGAFKVAVVAGLTGMACFAICGGLIFLSVIGLNVMPRVLTLMAIVIFGFASFIAAPIGMIFAIRSAYLRMRLARYVNEQMSTAGK